MLVLLKNNCFFMTTAALLTVMTFVPYGKVAQAQDISVEIGQIPEDTEVIELDIDTSEIAPPPVSAGSPATNEVEPVEGEAKAVEKETMKMPSGEPTMEDMMDRIELNVEKPDEKKNPISSLFFTVREHALLVEARRGFVTRAPGEEEIDSFNPDTVVMGPRVLELGGIVYISSNDWVIWLNGQRITQDAIPPEILDIKVRKEYIQIQWFDEFTNQIFPVKLRSNQRFNIDSRIFLPGE